MQTEKAVISRHVAAAATPFFLISVAAAAIAAAPETTQLGATGLLLAALAITGVCHKPQLWLYLFFAVDLLSPPLPARLLPGGIHLAQLAVILGIFAGILTRNEWRLRGGRLLLATAAFALALVVSLPFAILYSGSDVATGSAARIGLFFISVYVFAYAGYAPARSTVDPERFSSYLFALASLSAAFACLDFYFHFPAPAGFSDQYVWLENGVFRRAQGLFYDAGTLGNFCAFFLVYAFVAASERRNRGQAPRLLLLLGSLVLSAALILSCSRASVVNVIVAATACAILRGVRIRRLLAGAAVAGLAAVLAVQLLYPQFAVNYWSHVNGTIRYFSERPDGVLSGRLTNWQVLLAFVGSHPLETVFGIGYKTLPYTSHLGDPVIADNTYLSLLVETGPGGLAAFLALLAMILRTSLRAARSPHSPAGFLGAWTFCFWCGQAVQFMSGDLLTFWRVLPLYFWAAGATIRSCGSVE